MVDPRTGVGQEETTPDQSLRARNIQNAFIAGRKSIGRKIAGITRRAKMGRTKLGTNQKTVTAPALLQKSKWNSYWSCKVNHLSDVWILDSGCTYHMCPSREWFDTYEPCDGGSVLIGNDAACKTIAMGTIKIRMAVELLEPWAV